MNIIVKKTNDKKKIDEKKFRAVKTLTQKKFENSFVHVKDGKYITNLREIYETMSSHFKIHFCNENVQGVSSLIGRVVKSELKAIKKSLESL